MHLCAGYTGEAQALEKRVSIYSMARSCALLVRSLMQGATQAMHRGRKRQQCPSQHVQSSECKVGCLKHPGHSESYAQRRWHRAHQGLLWVAAHELGATLTRMHPLEKALKLHCLCLQAHVLQSGGWS